MTDRKAYSGENRRLVLAFDLGTTFSGVSYAILQPRMIPTIMTVSRYPGQETGDSKIPTVIHYDKRGSVLAVGAEEPQVTDEDDENDGRVDEPLRLEWFKLLLRPNSLPHSSDIPSPRLPGSKTIVDVYADFYRYLFSCARSFIQQSHVLHIWDSVENDIEFVLSHPNGWGGAQQSAMRRSVVKAGLISDTPSGHSRVTFVSEGEASLHYCVLNGLVSDIRTGSKVMIVDAGGGTVDISTYSFKATTPIEVQEVTVPGCLFEGSVIVRSRAEKYVRAKLRNSTKFGNESYIKAISEEFDRTAKKKFKGTGDASVKFSHLITDRDPAFGISRGIMRLPRDDTCGFFDPGIAAIVDAIRIQRRGDNQASIDDPVKTVFLVGGFAANEYLYDELKRHLAGEGFEMYRPDAHANKAVAEGAVSFHLDHYVSTRVARLTYGVECTVMYDKGKASHRTRKHLTFKDYDGDLSLENSFMPILSKGTQVYETQEFREPLVFNRKGTLETLRRTAIEVDFLSHAGSPDMLPEFIDDSYSRLFRITGYLEGVPSTQRAGRGSRRKKGGGNYHRQEIDVVFSFGLTELKAQLAWIRQGVEHRSPARIIYDEDFAVIVSG